MDRPGAYGDVLRMGGASPRVKAAASAGADEYARRYLRGSGGGSRVADAVADEYAILARACGGRNHRGHDVGADRGNRIRAANKIRAYHRGENLVADHYARIDEARGGRHARAYQDIGQRRVATRRCERSRRAYAHNRPTRQTVAV